MEGRELVARIKAGIDTVRQYAGIVGTEQET